MNSDTFIPQADKHFYGRRKNRLIRGTRSTALEEVIERYTLHDAKDVTALCDGRPLWMEIGFGGGEHLIEQAVQNPHAHIIGCEPFLNGASSLATQILQRNATNVTLWLDDALTILNALPDESLERVFLLFPDPWPKVRHHKRRFIQPHILDILARVMKAGGSLRLATDDNNLAQWMLLHTVQHDAFLWDNREDGSWNEAPSDWVETRYQQKAAQQGRLAHFMTFTRQES